MEADSYTLHFQIYVSGCRPHNIRQRRKKEKEKGYAIWKIKERRRRSERQPIRNRQIVRKPPRDRTRARVKERNRAREAQRAAVPTAGQQDWCLSEIKLNICPNMRRQASQEEERHTYTNTLADMRRRLHSNVHVHHTHWLKNASTLLRHLIARRRFITHTSHMRTRSMA